MLNVYTMKVDGDQGGYKDKNRGFYLKTSKAIRKHFLIKRHLKTKNMLNTYGRHSLPILIK